MALSSAGVTGGAPGSPTPPQKSPDGTRTVSTMGITGERAELDAAARGLVERLRAFGAENACVGIGISNAEQVAKIRRIVEELGYEVATPAEARAVLGLKGGDRVNF